MKICIEIPDERLSEFAEVTKEFFRPSNQSHEEVEKEELWGVKDIAAYLGKTASNLYGSQSYLIPSDSLAVNGGRKNRKWKKSTCLNHLSKIGKGGGLHV